MQILLEWSDQLWDVPSLVRPAGRRYRPAPGARSPCSGPRGGASASARQEAAAAVSAFLAELVLDRVRGIEDRTTTLRAAAGTGSVVDNLTDALQDLFGPVTVAIVALITFRDGLRPRLREAGLTGIPLAVQGTAMIAAYLTAERELGRLAGDADIDTLTPTLVGAGHLLFADRTSAPPQTAAVRKMVTTVIAGALRPPQP